MLSRTGVIRAAKQLMSKYDGDALLRAMQRASELLDDGDIDGTMTWSQIIEAIEDLQLEERESRPAA